MGKNSDLKNIFESYYNNVVLGEADNNAIQTAEKSITALEQLKAKETDPEKIKQYDTLIQNAKTASGKTDKTTNTATPQPQAAATPQPQASPSPSPSPAPQAAATPEPKPNLSPVSIGGFNIGGAQIPQKPSGSTPTNLSPVSIGGVPVGGQLTTQQATAPQTQQPITKTPEGGLGLSGITIGSPTGAGTTQQQIPSSAGVDVKIPASLQSPALMPQQQEPLKVGDNITIGKPEAAKEAPIQPTKQQAPSGKAKTSGGSIVDYLASKGQATDKASRTKLAAQYGIQNYTGTAEQNTQLLSMLKSGQQPKAAEQPAAQEQPKQKKGMGGIVGGVSKAIGSAGQAAKQATIGTKKPLGGVLGGISKAIGGAGKLAKTALVGNQEEAEEGWVEQGEPEVENVTDQYDTEETEGGIKENINISKFLKCLSEKNYHQANIHLNEIIQNKVKKKLSNSIK